MSGKALILFCHPEPKSFNGRIRDATEKFLKDKRFEVKIIDLCATKFNAVGGQHDFTKLSNPDHFDYQGEQKHAAENDCFAQDVKEHMELLTWCDHLILIFPFYWFNIPGCLKGWFDRILAYHYAYGGNKSIGGKMFYSCTTGAPSQWYSAEGRWGRTIEDYLANLWATAKLLQMELMKGKVSYGINFKKQEEKDETLEEYKKHLDLVFK